MLSLATQLGLIPTRLSMLLLGVTAISLLTTPLVFTLAHHVLPRETAGLLPLASPGPKRLTSMEPNVTFDREASAPRNGTSGPGSGSGGPHLRPRQSSGIAEREDASEHDVLSPWVAVDEGARCDDAHGLDARKARRSPPVLPVSALDASRSSAGPWRSNERVARAPQHECLADAQPHHGHCVHRGAQGGGDAPGAMGWGVADGDSGGAPRSSWSWWGTSTSNTSEAADGGRQGGMGHSGAAIDGLVRGGGSFG